MIQVKKIFITLILISFVHCQSTNSTQKPSLNTIIQVSPSALDVMINAFDNVIVYFHHKENQTELDKQLHKLQSVKQQIKESFPTDHTLFGYVNLTEDYKNNLKRFGKHEGFKILNRFTEPESFLQRQAQEMLFFNYQTIAHPKLQLSYSQDALDSQDFVFKLLFKFKDTNKLKQYNQIYQKVKFYLEQLHLGLYAVPLEKDSKETISLYHHNQPMENYFFTNLTIIEMANELVQEVSIDTLPIITTLDESNMHRVFGGSVSDQLIFLYKKNADSEVIERAKKHFKEAAHYNKENQLTYERVLFCQTSEEFFEEQFNEEVSNIFSQLPKKSKDYVILFTRTDYDRFNLKKYILKTLDQQLSSEIILQFIEDARMKRLDPQYKSQKAPSQQQNSGVIRKIVGSTFIKQIYQKPDQSIIVMFIDSKDESSYIEALQILEQFAQKYKKQFEDKLTFGVFDLAKNEHKLLYLKEAPQIVLFDKANKKQTKYFRINEGVSIQALERWVNKQVSNARIVKVENQL